MKILTFNLLIALSIGFFSCTNSSFPQPPKYVDNYSRKFVSIIKDKSVDSTLLYVSKDLQTQNSKEFFLKVSADIKFKQQEEVKILGYNVTTAWNTNQKSSKVYTTDYEFKYDNWYYAFSISVLELDNNLSVIGFNANKFIKPIEEINSFSFSNVGLVHIIFIIIVVTIIGFIIFSVINIVKSAVKKKWLWILISLIGFCGLSFNWTTGDINFQFFTIKILGIGFSKSGVASPWFLSLTVPIGAIIYWIKKPGILFSQELNKGLNIEK